MTIEDQLAVFMPLIREFCEGAIQAPEFDRKYCNFWEQCRDEGWRLFAEFQKQDSKCRAERTLPISERDLLPIQRFINLRPMYAQKIEDVRDRIYTACDCYYEDISEEELDPPGVINGRMLQEEVRGMLKEIEDILAEKEEASDW